MKRLGSRNNRQFRVYGAMMAYFWSNAAAGKDGYRFGKNYESNNVVVAEKARLYGSPWFYHTAAAHCGVATMWEIGSRDVILVGRKQTVKCFIEFYPSKTNKWQMKETSIGLDKIPYGSRIWANFEDEYLWEVAARDSVWYSHRGGSIGPEVDKAYLATYDRWLSLNKILHKIVEISPKHRRPQLSSWQARPFTGPDLEVGIVPIEKSLVVSGCVWQSLMCGETSFYKRSLGLPSPFEQDVYGKREDVDIYYNDEPGVEQVANVKELKFTVWDG